jgi:hypothetical protein
VSVWIHLALYGIQWQVMVRVDTSGSVWDPVEGYGVCVCVDTSGSVWDRVAGYGVCVCGYIWLCK